MATSDATENSPTTATQAESTTSSATTLQNLPPYIGNIQMISQGENPKTKLRYQPQEGTQTIRITQNQRYGQTGNESVISYAIDIEANITQTGEDYTLTFEIVDVSAADGPQNERGSDFFSVISRTLLAGHDWNITVNSVGQRTDDTKKNYLNALRQSEAMLPFLRTGFIVALPTDEVGVGATWKVRQDTELTTFLAVQETEYKITSIEGTVLELETKTRQLVEQGAAPAEKFWPMMEEAGYTARVKEWESSGTGTMRINLAKTFPQFSGTVSSDQVLERNTLERGQHDQSLKISTDITIKSG